jgi:hypothetical protein
MVETDVKPIRRRMSRLSAIGLATLVSKRIECILLCTMNRAYVHCMAQHARDGINRGTTSVEPGVR